MADLWERLKAAQNRGPRAEEPPPPSPEAEPAPGGWEWHTPLVARRCLRVPLEPRFWEALRPLVDAEAWRGVLCFDTETTGLSGGAGTVPFLVGWAHLVPGDEPVAEVHQWFLRDLPGEPEMVAALDGEFRSARGLVSFNGASFDLPLLRSRWALTGREFPEADHRDDLHPARRLWKRLLESCRLGRLEETVLGLKRVDDVPGALVPALWFDYLRSGAGPDFATLLDGVLRHHAQDVYSLLCLDLLMSAIHRNPGHPRWAETIGPFPQRIPLVRPAPGGLLHPDLGRSTPADFWGLLSLKNEDQAGASLERRWAADRSEAVGLAWADRLKRRRDPRGVEVWTELWQDRRSYPALVELLKWLEHRDRGDEARTQALELVSEALKAPFLPQLWRQALEKRKNRLAPRE